MLAPYPNMVWSFSFKAVFFVPPLIYTRIIDGRNKNMKENDFITITNIKEYIEIGMIKIGEVLHLKKEPDNVYDMESIMVERQE